ncbi:alpha/beta hydrolase [Vagococcus vulneris]|uniref:Alpha/beta hydrolase n=1 Tax=Vagococcus vulneris TaxID=1977869 RepID=A0A429ZXA2_9ENTE|nr:alpha/beta hydrolase [Vagococcus vulneris]RST98445.1 alpha/beta hydrolase [Vagococcus vulneris]
MKLWGNFMKKVCFILVVIVLIGVIGSLGYATNYLFNYAVVSGEKDFLDKPNKEKQKKEWDFSKGKTNKTEIESNDGLTLRTTWVNQTKKTNKVVIAAHGYMQSAEKMGAYTKIFYDLGFDVLVPDNRAHGKSEGKYVGFGWLDRLDYLRWIDEVIKKKGNDVEIVLFGESMGAAAVMMVSGEKLPPQVKVIIEDCGYASVSEELTFQLKDLFNLPAFPLIPLTSFYTKLRAGYSFYEADAVKQLQKNRLPVLFIHGDSDKFVPTSMVYELYDATKGSKKMKVFKGSGHAESVKDYPKEYQETIQKFLNEYLN